MVEVKVVKKYNPRTKALETEEFAYDVTTLFSNKVTAESSGEITLGVYSVPSGKIAIITSVKYASSSGNTWFNFSGDITDYAYLATAGEGILTGSADNPVWTLDENQSVTVTVANAQSGVTYAITLYGRLRNKVFKGLTP